MFGGFGSYLLRSFPQEDDVARTEVGQQIKCEPRHRRYCGADPCFEVAVTEIGRAEQSEHSYSRNTGEGLSATNLPASREWKIDADDTKDHQRCAKKTKSRIKKQHEVSCNVLDFLCLQSKVSVGKELSYTTFESILKDHKKAKSRNFKQSNNLKESFRLTWCLYDSLHLSAFYWRDCRCSANERARSDVRLSRRGDVEEAGGVRGAHFKRNVAYDTFISYGLLDVLYSPFKEKFFALCLIVLCNTMCSSDAVVEPPSPLFRNTVAIVVAGALGPPILPVIAVIATAVPLFSQTVANYLAAVVPPILPAIAVVVDTTYVPPITPSIAIDVVAIPLFLLLLLFSAGVVLSL